MARCRLFVVARRERPASRSAKEHDDAGTVQRTATEPTPGSSGHRADAGRFGTAALVVEKNVAVAALLGFFFGPIGMIYATGIGALVMFGVNIVIGILTFGLGLFLTWPVCAIWAGVAAGNHNARARQQAYAAMNRPPGW